MKHLSVSFLALLVLGFSTNAQAEGGEGVSFDVAGKYDVEGENPNGTTYSGTAEIIMTGRGTCTVRWVFANENAEGTCLVRGRNFTSAYWLKGAIGIANYEIRDDGSMHGLWILGQDDEPGTETMTLSK